MVTSFNCWFWFYFLLFSSYCTTFISCQWQMYHFKYFSTNIWSKKYKKQSVPFSTNKRQTNLSKNENIGITYFCKQNPFLFVQMNKWYLNRFKVAWIFTYIILWTIYHTQVFNHYNRMGFMMIVCWQQLTFKSPQMYQWIYTYKSVPMDLLM